VRKSIINAVHNILNDLHIFKKIYDLPTLIEQERSFPVAWINLKGEMFTPAGVQTTNSFRNAELTITIGQKNDRGEDNLNALIDSIYDAIRDNYTLSGTVINLTPTYINTDEGYLFPYALASLTFTLTFRS